MNYEIVPMAIPTNKREVEELERWLEKVSSRGGELITVMASGRSDTALGIFRATSRGAARSESGERAE